MREPRAYRTFQLDFRKDLTPKARACITSLGDEDWPDDRYPSVRIEKTQYSLGVTVTIRYLSGHGPFTTRQAMAERIRSFVTDDRDLDDADRRSLDSLRRRSVGMVTPPVQILEMRPMRRSGATSEGTEGGEDAL